jgi:hypothetical protein
LVLRCHDVEGQFYEHLGIVFTKEKHQKGQEHYSWENLGLLLELYPAAEGRFPTK